jgi:hypothetical protein
MHASKIITPLEAGFTELACVTRAEASVKAEVLHLAGHFVVISGCVQRFPLNSILNLDCSGLSTINRFR